MKRIPGGVMVVLNVGDPDDSWLRAMCRGEAPVPVKREQRVIVETFDEADRICHGVGRLKHQRKLPYGGSMTCRVDAL